MTRRQALALSSIAAALVLLPVGAVAHPGGVTLTGFDRLHRRELN